MRNNLPERLALGKSKFLPKNYAGYFDEKAKNKNILNSKLYNCRHRNEMKLKGGQELV